MTGESVELKKDILAVCNSRKQELSIEMAKVAASDKDKERRRILPSPIL